MNPLAKNLAARQVLILDGALATELERRGHDLNHALWSARFLMEDPNALREVHLSYLPEYLGLQGAGLKSASECARRLGVLSRPLEITLQDG